MLRPLVREWERLNVFQCNKKRQFSGKRNLAINYLHHLPFSISWPRSLCIMWLMHDRQTCEKNDGSIFPKKELKWTWAFNLEKNEKYNDLCIVQTENDNLSCLEWVTGDWNLSKLEFVRNHFTQIGICQNWNLSESEFVRIGISQNWN